MYDKENARFHDRRRKEALWSEIAATIEPDSHRCRVGLSPIEIDMANFTSNSLDRHPESLPEDSHGFMNIWVS